VCDSVYHPTCQQKQSLESRRLKYFLLLRAKKKKKQKSLRHWVGIDGAKLTG